MLCEHGNTTPCVECDIGPLQAECEKLREINTSLETIIYHDSIWKDRASLELTTLKEKIKSLREEVKPTVGLIEDIAAYVESLENPNDARAIRAMAAENIAIKEENEQLKAGEADLVEALEKIKNLDSEAHHSISLAKIIARYALTVYHKGGANHEQ